MLTTEKKRVLDDLLAGTTPQEIIWMNGYLAGLLRNTSAAPAATPATPRKFTLLYATETGNAKALAAELAAVAKREGAQVKLASMAQYKPANLRKEDPLLMIISTQGDGDPPESARAFFAHLATTTEQYPSLRFAVLGLGDTSYPLFCKAGEDLDHALEQVGAKRIAPLRKCDTDYAAEAHAWFRALLHTSSNSAPVAVDQAAPAKAKQGALQGRVITNVPLTDEGSDKLTHHLEIAAEGVVYEPGDAATIAPHNSAAAVRSVLQLLQAEESSVVAHGGIELTLVDVLTRKLNIAYLSDRSVSRFAKLIDREIPQERLSLAELLRRYPLPAGIGVQRLVDVLEALIPRHYSISSSPQAHPDEVHLTVAAHTFPQGGNEGQGLASHYLVNLPEGTELEFRIHTNRAFRLPSPEKDVLLIGPGTGIAPFRSFLAERDAQGATGRNWLFFGERRSTTDFLYQTELQAWADTGLLTRISTAFSREGAEKVYVQHRLREHGAEVYQWLLGGAHLYVCGSKAPMSLDVEAALVELIAEHGSTTAEKARLQLDEWAAEGRYSKDVY
jgi:sulfite reductase (NADPH) flavoprotein alpha-component